MSRQRRCAPHGVLLHFSAFCIFFRFFLLRSAFFRALLYFVQVLEDLHVADAVRAASVTFDKGMSKFTKSPRFLKACDKAFKTVDLDNSGSIDKAELFIAILLLNHELNKIPFLGRQEPPTRYARTSSSTIVCSFFSRTPAPCGGRCPSRAVQPLFIQRVFD